MASVGKAFHKDIELVPYWMGSKKNFPEYRGRVVRIGNCGKIFVGRAPNGEVLPATRIISYKTKPSLHKCDARCMGAKGTNCECSCGGKNHGANRDF